MDERHYNVRKLNVIFAISSLVLLGSIGIMFLDDFDRSWKNYQKSYRSREAEKARVQYDAELLRLENDSAYQEAKEALGEAQKQFAANCTGFHDIETQLDDLKAENDVLQQKYKFSKAEMDVSRYEYESVAAHGGAGDPQVLKAGLDALQKKTAELELKVEASDAQLAAKQKIIKDCGVSLRELEKRNRELAQQKTLIERKLGKVDLAAMSAANQLATVVRDLPIIDLANPNNKIEQIVIKDIQDDVNFMTVPKVDRCVTCHLGITNPDYADAIQPFKTHPNLTLYLDKDSPHPLEEFGCTVCHGGRGRSTEFSGAAHTPRNEAQRKEWKKKYNYAKIELWEEPMYPLQYTEAGCFKCHSGEGFIKGAEKLSLGLHVIEKAGCYNCHAMDRYKGWPKSGPDLTQLASKISKEFAYKWIEDPRSFRHNTWMPSYFNLDNNSDSESQKRGLQEIHAIVHYLFVNSKPFPLSKMPQKGDAIKGEEIVVSAGCFACHQIAPDKTAHKSTIHTLRQEFGPNLAGLGSKTSKDWIYQWLKNPKRYHPDTRMPDLRLTDQEAADVTEFLYQYTADDFAGNKVPALDEEILNEITFGFLGKQNPKKIAQEKLAAMKLDDKLLFSGEKLIGQYGCFSCHNIAGFENAKPIGIELTEEGSKSLHNLDFGFVHIDHSKHAWFTQKLRDPRIFDRGKVKRPDEKLMMPNFYLTDEEIEAAVTAIMGMVKTNTIGAKVKPRTPENLAIEAGQMIVKQMNCQGCHILENEGGSVQNSVKEWLVKYNGSTENDAEKIYESFSPPNLHGVGIKLNPEWLFNFLHNPQQQVRPWLKIRMPTYGFNVEHLNILLRYFHTLDQEKFPFDLDTDTTLTKKEYEAAEKLFSEEYFGCTQCHVVGDKLPTGSQDSWAPNLALAKTRLQPDWLIEWIKNPQELMPGTKMPNFFDPDDYENSGPSDILDGNEDEQLRVLRNFLLQLTDAPAESKKKPEVKAETAPEPAAAPPAETVPNQ